MQIDLLVILKHVCFTFGAVMAPKFFFYLLLVLCAIVYGVGRYRFLSRQSRLLVQLLIVVFLSESIGRYLVFSTGNVHPVYHFLVMVQIVYYGLIYRVLFRGAEQARLLFTLLAAGFLAVFVVNSTSFQSLYTFPSLPVLLLSLYVIPASLLSFYFMLRSPVEIPIWKQSLFWFHTGNIFFYSITFFFFGFYKYLQDLDEFIPEWGFYLIWASNMLLYTCYFYSLYLDRNDLNRPHGPVR